MWGILPAQLWNELTAVARHEWFVGGIWCRFCSRKHRALVSATSVSPCVGSSAFCRFSPDSSFSPAAPAPGATSPVSLRLRGKNYPLPMSGTLWIEPQSGAIVKLEANVDSGMSDLGLKSMRSEVHYALHTFHNPAESVWIAESATIEVETPRQHWRNLHRFSDYKRFNVNVHEEMGKLP